MGFCFDSGDGRVDRDWENSAALARDAATPNGQTEAAAMGCPPRVTPMQDVKELRRGPPGDWGCLGTRSCRQPSVTLLRCDGRDPEKTDRCRPTLTPLHRFSFCQRTFCENLMGREGGIFNRGFLGWTRMGRKQSGKAETQNRGVFNRERHEICEQRRGFLTAKNAKNTEKKRGF